MLGYFGSARLPTLHQFLPGRLQIEGERCRQKRGRGTFLNVSTAEALRFHEQPPGQRIEESGREEKLVPPGHLFELITRGECRDGHAHGRHRQESEGVSVGWRGPVRRGPARPGPARRRSNAQAGVHEVSEGGKDSRDEGDTCRLAGRLRPGRQRQIERGR